MEDNLLVSLALPLANVIIMLAVGLVLQVSDLSRAIRAPRQVAAGLLGQYVLVPLLAFSIAIGFELPTGIAIGLVLVAACPSASVSNLLSHFARGNVGLAVTLTGISAFASLASIPLLVGLASRWWEGAAQQIQLPLAQTLVRLLLFVVLPLIAGMLLRHIAPTYAARMERWASRMGLVALVTVIIVYVVQHQDLLGEALQGLWLPVLLQGSAAMAGGYLLGTLTRLAHRDAITIAMEVGVHNCMLALLVASTVMKSDDAALPALTYGVLMFVPALVLVIIGRKLSYRVTGIGEPQYQGEHPRSCEGKAP